MAALNQSVPALLAPGFTVTLLAGRVGLRLSGDADLCNVDALQRAAAALPPDAHEICLELATLNFIDVRATRELVALTRRPARPTLILHNPPDTLLRLITIAWPEALPQFVFCDDRRAWKHGRAVASPPTFREPWAGAFRNQSTCRPEPDIAELMRSGNLMIKRLQQELDGNASPARCSLTVLTAVWDRLADLIDLHTAAEDEIALLAVFGMGPQRTRQMNEAVADHDDIREMVAEARLQPVGSPLWWELVETALSAWTRHIVHEERSVLTHFQRHSEPVLRSRLGRQWLAFRDAWTRDRPTGADLDGS